MPADAKKSGEQFLPPGGVLGERSKGRWRRGVLALYRHGGSLVKAGSKEELRERGRVTAAVSSEREGEGFPGKKNLTTRARVSARCEGERGGYRFGRAC
jgi:hypothetical protein